MSLIDLYLKPVDQNSTFSLPASLIANGRISIISCGRIFENNYSDLVLVKPYKTKMGQEDGFIVFRQNVEINEVEVEYIYTLKGEPVDEKLPMGKVKSIDGNCLLVGLGNKTSAIKFPISLVNATLTVTDNSKVKLFDLGKSIYFEEFDDDVAIVRYVDNNEIAMMYDDDLCIRPPVSLLIYKNEFGTVCGDLWTDDGIRYSLESDDTYQYKVYDYSFPFERVDGSLTFCSELSTDPSFVLNTIEICLVQTGQYDLYWNVRLLCIYPEDKMDTVMSHMSILYGYDDLIYIKGTMSDLARTIAEKNAAKLTTTEESD